MAVKAFQKLLEEIKKVAPGVRGEAHETWARSQIRESIADQLETDEVSDLDEVPRPERWAVSISHCVGLAGWMATLRPVQIGWDVEIKSRIQLPIIKRICNANEISQAPDPSFLWPAKESFFKAAEDEQPNVVSQLTIGPWRSITPGLWSWQGFGPRNGEGLLLETEDLLLAACLIR